MGGVPGKIVRLDDIAQFRLHLLGLSRVSEVFYYPDQPILGSSFPDRSTLASGFGLFGPVAAVAR